MKISINRPQQLPRLLLTIALFTILAACGGSSTATLIPPINQNDTILESLTLSSGSLSPAFSSTVTDYTITTKASTTTVTVTPTASNAKFTIIVNGTTTDTDSVSAPINLTVGENTITLIVTAEDTTTKTYSITVTRIALSTDADLSGLALSTGSLNTAFASDVTAYTLSTKAISTTVTPTVSDANATVTVNDTTTNSGGASAPIDLTVGDNTINVIVTAEDASTKTYSITVTRIALSTDADLSNLALSTGSLNTAFDSNTTAYTVSTKAETITVTPTVSDTNATVTVNGTATASGSASASIDLTAGENVITLIVTAEDATTKTYSITVTRIALSTDANLSGLVISTDSLNTAFASNTTAYTVSTKAISTTVTPTVSDANATVTVNGTATDTGSASASINLTVGENTINVIVTAEDASTKTYSITVTRIALSTDADLSNLVLSTGSLNTAFDSNTTAYTVSTKAETITVTPTVSDTNATVTVNGTATASGSASASIDLTVGENVITLIVTAEDASTKTYSITVTRIALSTDADLSNLALSTGSLNTAFASDVTAYTLSTKAISTTVTPTVSDANATVTVNGTATDTGSASASINLTVGENTINVIVTAEDASTKTYSITVTRIALSTDADLSNLALSTGSLNTAFDSNTTAYTVSTKAETITVTPTVSDTNATVTVNGTATASGSASASIDLTAGENVITLIVTAEDATTKTYSITVTRIALSTDANLSSLVLSAGSFSPAFASNVTDYSFIITADTTTVTPTVTPTVSDANATVEVNGTDVSSGNVSDVITLAAGETNIKVVVTAEDTSSKTYTITVSRIADLELISPNPAANQKFGEKVVQLANGNIIVNVVGNDENKGAVYLYKPTSGTVFKSYRGLNAGDKLGSGGIIPLANNHFLIVSPSADNDALDAAGSVTWVNGSTGEKGTTLRGDSANDTLGSGGVHLLDDNTIIINSPNYKSNGIATGAVMLLTNSGDSIKTTLYGNDNASFTTTKLGDKGITLLGNGKFVIVSTEHTNKTFANAGIVHLVDSSGVVIGQPITGQGLKADEKFGGDGITPLKDGNFLIATQTYDASEGTTDLTNAGSIHLINGADGKQIGETLIGNKKDGYLGKTSGSGTTSAGNAATTTITPLGNNNYVVLHHTADNDTVTNAGSVRLFSGADGIQVGATVRGDFEDDFKDDLTHTKIIVLANSNYVITAPYSDETVDGNTKANVGSIRLMNGANGAQLTIKYGDIVNDRLGYDDVIELSNHKYVVASTLDNGFNGSVMLFNGEGVLEGSLIGSDLLGSSGLTALGNNKFVIASGHESNKEGMIAAGSIRLVDANVVDDKGNIKEIATIYGDNAYDHLGDGGATLLNNHNFLFTSLFDDVDGIQNAGLVQVVNGTTGVAGNKIVGLKRYDMHAVQIIKPVIGDYFILSQPLADDNGTDAGKVRLVVPRF